MNSINRIFEHVSFVRIFLFLMQALLYKNSSGTQVLNPKNGAYWTF